jgi:hypothetical protein
VLFLVIDAKAETRDEFILYTYTFVKGQGIVSTNLSSKYDGKLTVTTVTSINEVPTIPVGSTTIEAQVKEEDGYLLYITTYASGAGVIGVSTDTKYEGKLTLTTTTTLNQPPSGISNLIRSESSQSDYGTIYTYTTATGAGEIGRSTDNKYGGTLTLTTITSLNVVPEETGYLFRTDVNDTDYGAIYTYTWAEGSGQIGTSTDNKYNGTLTLITITSLNAVPTGTGYLFRTDSNETDYGTIYTYTWASGSGQIGTSTDNKYGGTLTLTTITSLNVVPTGTGYLFRTDSNETDYGTIYTYTWASGEGEIGSSVDKKYNGTLTLTTKISLNVAPTGSGYLFKTDSTETDYGTVYTYAWASGEGEIGTSTDYKYNGTLTLTTKVSLNVVPDGSGYLFRTDSNETDYGTIYTYTWASGEGEIGSSVDNKYGGTLTLTTKVSLKVAPTGTGYLFKTDSTETEFGTVYTYTWADGEGEIGRSSSSRNQGKLEIVSVTYLDTPSPTTPAGYTIIGSQTEKSDFGIISTIKYAKGEGQIAYTTQARSDGSVVNSYTILGDQEPSAPASSYLMEKSYEAGDGYDIFTYYYYSKPNNYDVPVATSWNKPNVLGWSKADGFYILEAGGLEPVTGTATVTFSTSAPSAVSIADPELSCWASENVKYTDGTRLSRRSVFQNTFYNSAGGTGEGGDYQGSPCTNFATSSGGDNRVTGTVIINWDTVPYFYAGGTTIYKTTQTEVTVP